MKLLACHVSNFGTLHEASYTFCDGLNVVLEENGAGKSTLAAFIKVMLYGLTPSRSKNPEENERLRFSPWQGGAFGGWLSFEAGARRYRVERTFGQRPAQDRFKLFDADTGLESADYTKNLGEELFGVDASAYERSVWHPQRAVTFSQNAGLAAKLGGGENSADVQQFKGASDALDKYRKQIENMHKHGLLPDTRAALEKARREEEQCRAYLQREQELRAQVQTLEEQIARKRDDLGAAREAVTEALNARERLARQETWRMLNRRCGEADAALAALEKDFANGVPEEGQLSGAARLIAQARQARAQAAGAMELSDITRLAGLTERFANGAPSQQALSVLLKEAGRVDETQARVDEERARIVTARAALGDGFENGVPDEEECAEAQDAAARAAEGAFALRQDGQRQAAAKRKTYRGLLAVSGGIAILGAVCFAFSNAAAFSFLALGAVLAFLALMLMKKQSDDLRRSDAQARRRTDALMQKADAFLSRYEGQSARDGATREERIRGVCERARRYENLAQELCALEERAGVNEERAAALLQTLSSMHQSVEGTYAEAVMALSQAAAQYRALCAARDDSRRRMAESSEQAQALETQIQAFFSRYGASIWRDADDADEALSQIRARAAQCRAAAQEARRAHAALAQYERENAQTQVDAEEPQTLDADALRAREKALSDELMALEGERNIRKKEADDLSEYAERLQLLQSECAELAGRCAELEEHYRIVTQTQTYLSRAYDALRSGYRRILRRGLCRYAEIVTGRDESALDVDADFSVTAVVQGQSRAYANFSRGQRDVLDICMRLALCDALFEGERPFLVLDDPFANLDDQNVARARALLEKLADDRQILYLACHSSRA